MQNSYADVLRLAGVHNRVDRNANGSADDLSRAPGLAEHTLRLKAYWDSVKARSHILTMLELASFETDPEERRRLLTFVCVGGNFGGIEVAGELADYFGVLVKKRNCLGSWRVSSPRAVSR